MHHSPVCAPLIVRWGRAHAPQPRAPFLILMWGRARAPQPWGGNLRMIFRVSSLCTLFLRQRSFVSDTPQTQLAQGTVSLLTVEVVQ